MKQEKKKPNKNTQERSERFWRQKTCKDLNMARAAHLSANKGRDQNAGFNH
ncbi:hypothetical protein [Bacillus atrophaeus]|uniref:hypothetical protein n=1 Tax=Bacillus atrophaeus TaxID=1452 RepID=UPI00399047B9